MELTAKAFSGSQVAEAAGISPATLQSWMIRYQPSDEARPTGAGSQGRRRLFTYHNAISVVVASALAPSLRSTELALQAGWTFGHFAQGDVEGFCRAPGVPYTDPKGKVETLLCVSEKGTCVVPRFEGFDWWKFSQMSLGNPEAGIYCLAIDGLWADACWKMKLPPNDVMKAAMLECGDNG